MRKNVPPYPLCIYMQHTTGYIAGSKVLLVLRRRWDEAHNITAPMKPSFANDRSGAITWNPVESAIPDFRMSEEGQVTITAVSLTESMISSTTHITRIV